VETTDSPPKLDEIISRLSSIRPSQALVKTRDELLGVLAAEEQLDDLTEDVAFEAGIVDAVEEHVA